MSDVPIENEDGTTILSDMDRVERVKNIIVWACKRYDVKVSVEQVPKVNIVPAAPQKE